MIDQVFLIGMSTGMFSMLLFDMGYNAWNNYITALRMSRCSCKDGEE
jgi:flagellar biosynthesis protein FlhB